jgi:hypothetical protein
MASNQECVLNFLNLLRKSTAQQRNLKWGFTINTMEGMQRKGCARLFMAQVWTQFKIRLYGICGKMSLGRHYFILLLFQEANVSYKLSEKGWDISKYQSYSILSI